MSNRRTTNTKALERALLRAAIRGDQRGVHTRAQVCRRTLTQVEMADALGRMAEAVGMFAAWVPEPVRSHVASELLSAEGIKR